MDNLKLKENPGQQKCALDNAESKVEIYLLFQDIVWSKEVNANANKNEVLFRF